MKTIKITLNELKNVIKQVIKESNDEFQNISLDNMNKQGGFDKLSDLDKLALLGGSGDYSKLKNLDLRKIYKDMGGEFGNKLIKVNIEDIESELESLKRKLRGE